MFHEKCVNKFHSCEYNNYLLKHTPTTIRLTKFDMVHGWMARFRIRRDRYKVS